MNIHPILHRAALYRECAANHRKNGDNDGHTALMFAAIHGPELAISRYPQALDAIRNARAYAEQEAA